LFTLLAPLEGFALAILLVPFNQLRRFWPSLIILTLLPLKIIVSRLLPEQLISLATARSSGLLLQALGMEVGVDGTVVMLPSGGVIVHGPCNGTEMICMVLIVALTFLLAFPLRHWRHRALVLVASPLVAMATNSIRIAILALIAATPSPHSDVMFDFFHLEAGSLLFSGVAVSLFALLYLAVLNKELTSRVLKEV
jgi:cyanoexosortase A